MTSKQPNPPSRSRAIVGAVSVSDCDDNEYEGGYKEMTMNMEKLQWEMEALKAEIEADIERLINPKRKRLAALELAFQNEQIEAWFRLHHEKRIAIGDAIIVTDEFNVLMSSRNTFPSTLGTEGKVIGLNYPITSDIAVRVETSGYQVSIPIDIALRMRQAWLSKQPQE